MCGYVLGGGGITSKRAPLSPHLRAPRLEMASRQSGSQTGRQSGRQSGKQADRQAGRQEGKIASRQAGDHAGNNTGKPASRQESKKASKRARRSAGRQSRSTKLGVILQLQGDNELQRRPPPPPTFSFFLFPHKCASPLHSVPFQAVAVPCPTHRHGRCAGW